MPFDLHLGNGIALKDAFPVRQHHSVAIGQPLRQHVDDEGHIDEALLRTDVGEVRYPEGVWPLGAELAIDLVQRARSHLVADGSLSLIHI